MLPTALLGSRIPLASLMQALAVAECLNFHHAANRLGISQSSVSARNKALEEQLGILPFDRNTRGVRITDDGIYPVIMSRHLEQAKFDGRVPGG